MLENSDCYYNIVKDLTAKNRSHAQDNLEALDKNIVLRNAMHHTASMLQQCCNGVTL